MTRLNRTLLSACLITIISSTLCVQSGLGQRASTAAASKQKGAPPDTRIERRTYHFADTNEDLPYAVFASSKVTKDKKNPLIIVLHPLNGTSSSMLTADLVDRAEAGGYIVFSPAGYNPRSWWGIPWPPSPSEQDDKVPNRPELAEKDVLNMLAMAGKEFNVDDRRVYLMGVSMGGAGTLYLGSKYASTWAAIAASAPAAQLMLSNMQSVVGGLTMPVFLAQGDADTAVPPAFTRALAGGMKNRNVLVEYKEFPGATHQSVWPESMPDVFAFFNAHTK